MPSDAHGSHMPGDARGGHMPSDAHGSSNKRGTVYRPLAQPFEWLKALVQNFELIKPP